MKSPDGYEVFKLFKSNKKITVTWGNNFSYFKQNIHYVGVTNGLGGYNKLLQEGWKDKRDFKTPCNKYNWITSNKQKFLRLKKIVKVSLDN